MFSPFPVPPYRISSLDESTTCVEYFLTGYKIEKIHEIFKMRKQILKVFLDGATHAAVSDLAHFFKKKTALPDPIGPYSGPAYDD